MREVKWLRHSCCCVDSGLESSEGRQQLAGALDGWAEETADAVLVQILLQVLQREGVRCLVVVQSRTQVSHA